MCRKHSITTTYIYIYISTAQQSCEPATAPVVWRLVTWQAVALPSRRQTCLIFHSFFNLFVVWSFRELRITSKELQKQGECQMCNDFLRQCYWKSPGTSFEAGLSLRARAPEFVSGRQESILCGPRHSQTFPDAPGVQNIEI